MLKAYQRHTLTGREGSRSGLEKHRLDQDVVYGLDLGERYKKDGENPTPEIPLCRQDA